jgi:hypothetical protein
MKIRTYKFLTFILLALVVTLGWMYWSVSSQMTDGTFISHQADILRRDLKVADPKSFRDYELILNDFQRYLAYYDAHTNSLARSPILCLLRVEQSYVLRDTVAYLRKTGTNDYGEDPDEWLKHLYPR